MYTCGSKATTAKGFRVLVPAPYLIYLGRDPNIEMAVKVGARVEVVRVAKEKKARLISNSKSFKN